jgi:hypothetical protein
MRRACDLSEGDSADNHGRSTAAAFFENLGEVVNAVASRPRPQSSRLQESSVMVVASRISATSTFHAP